MSILYTSSVRSKSSITGRRNLQINKLAAYPVCSIFNHQLSAMLIPLIRFVVFSFLSIVLLSCASTRQPANDTAADRMGNESVLNETHTNVVAGYIPKAYRFIDKVLNHTPTSYCHSYQYQSIDGVGRCPLLQAFLTHGR